MTPVLINWATKHNVNKSALVELMSLMGAEQTDVKSRSDSPEARVQDEARLMASKMGWRLFRNNCGALKDENGRVVRYGIANDSLAMNKRIKSSDLIGIRPVVITPDMVGSTIGQFVAREVKRAGWKYKGTEHEEAQLAFGMLVIGLGGDFKFWNGSGDL